MTKAPRQSIQAVLTLTLVCLGLLGLVPPVLGQTAPAHGQSTQNCFPPFVVTQVLGQIAAGTILFCADAPTLTATTASTFQVVASLTTPQILGAAGTNTITLGASANGCTIGTQTTRQTGLAAAFGSQTSTTAFVTMTSDSCTILWEGKVTVATTVVVYDAFEATNTYANPQSKVDNQNRLCAASTFAASCTTPILGNVNFQCGASLTTVAALGSTVCTTESRGQDDSAHCTEQREINDLTVFTTIGYEQYCIRYPDEVPPGTHFFVTQDLVYPIPISGTETLSAITDTFSGGTGCTITASLFDSARTSYNGLIHARATTDVVMTGQLCSIGWYARFPGTGSPVRFTQSIISTTRTPTITATVSGSLGVTGSITVTNAGGQTVTMSGTLDTLARFCAASPVGTTCSTPTVNTNSVSTIVGNSTQLVNFPGNLTVDLHSRGTLQGINGPGYDWWLEFTFWMLCFWYIKRNRSLIMLPIAMGGILHLVNPNWFFGPTASLPWLAVGAFIDVAMKTLRAERLEKKQRSMT